MDLTTINDGTENNWIFDNRPWDFGKNFDESAPCSALVPAAKIGHPVRTASAMASEGRLEMSCSSDPVTRWSVA